MTDRYYNDLTSYTSPTTYNFFSCDKDGFSTLDENIDYTQYFKHGVTYANSQKGQTTEDAYYYAFFST